MRSAIARYARAAAALFGVVTGALALASVGSSIVAGAAQLLALAPLYALYAVNAALLSIASLVVLVRGDRGRGAARVAGILLAGVALGYLPLAVVTSGPAAVGAVVPATAAVILLATSRGAAPGADGSGGRASPLRLGRLVLVVVAVAALAWAAVGVAGMATTAAGGGSGLGPYVVVRAAIVLGALHGALALVVGRLAGVAFLTAGAVDLGLGLGALVAPSAWALVGLLVAGVALLGLGGAALAKRPHPQPEPLS